MGVYYITNLCTGTIVDEKNATIDKKMKISSDKIVENKEWKRKFVSLSDLKKFITNNNIEGTEEFINTNNDLFLEEVGGDSYEYPPKTWSRYIKVRECFCNDEQKTMMKKCVICEVSFDKVMSKGERKWECCKKIVAICGLPEFVCDNCTNQGWYSTAGYGCGTQRLNSITGQKKI